MDPQQHQMQDQQTPPPYFQTAQYHNEQILSQSGRSGQNIVMDSPTSDPTFTENGDEVNNLQQDQEKTKIKIIGKPKSKVTQTA